MPGLRGLGKAKVTLCCDWQSWASPGGEWILRVCVAVPSHLCLQELHDMASPQSDEECPHFQLCPSTLYLPHSAAPQVFTESCGEQSKTLCDLRKPRALQSQVPICLSVSPFSVLCRSQARRVLWLGPHGLGPMLTNRRRVPFPPELPLS